MPLSQNLRILAQLVKSEFKLRYQNSALGYLWTLIKPLLLFGVIYLVFAVYMASPVTNYPIYLLIGVIIWNFFSECTLIGMNTFISKRDLVTKIYFHRSILVFASTLSSLITFLLNLVIFFIFLAISGIHIGFPSAFFIIYIFELYLISAGITFLLASLYIKFRDLQHIWEVLLQIGFWLTPIIYPVAVVPEKYHRFIFLNPLARIIEYTRDLFIRNHIPALELNLVLAAMSIAIFTFSYWIFQKTAPNIAEKI